VFVAVSDDDMLSLIKGLLAVKCGQKAHQQKPFLTMKHWNYSKI